MRVIEDHDGSGCSAEKGSRPEIEVRAIAEGDVHGSAFVFAREFFEVVFSNLAGAFERFWRGNSR